jgi:hypothetical protein
VKDNSNRNEGPAILFGILLPCDLKDSTYHSESSSFLMSRISKRPLMGLDPARRVIKVEARYPSAIRKLKPAEVYFVPA